MYAIEVKSDVINVVSMVYVILKREFPLLCDLELSEQTSLISAGWLDSFAVVTLVAALEDAFSIQIDVEKMEMSQLDTPSAIANFCLDTQLKRKIGEDFA